MLQVEMTPNLLGFTVKGDHSDLDALYDAVWDLVGSGEVDPADISDGLGIMKERLLALCYDLRHASRGDRGVELVDSGMGEWAAQASGVPLQESNVAYSFQVAYPEAVYDVMVLGCLVRRRTSALAKKTPYRRRADDLGYAMTDPSACEAMRFASLVLEAIGRQATPGRFARIREYASEGALGIQLMYTQWLDVITADYAGMSRKRRLESMSTVARDMVEFYLNAQYMDLVDDVDDFAGRNGCSRGDVRVVDYPDLDRLKW